MNLMPMLPIMFLLGSMALAIADRKDAAIICLFFSACSGVGIILGGVLR